MFFLRLVDRIKAFGFGLRLKFVYFFLGGGRAGAGGEFLEVLGTSALGVGCSFRFRDFELSREVLEVSVV